MLEATDSDTQDPLRSLERRMPADADIVTVEFAMNDKNSSKPWCGMETPVRYVVSDLITML